MTMTITSTTYVRAIDTKPSECLDRKKSEERKKMGRKEIQYESGKIAVADQLQARNPHFYVQMAILWCLATAVWSTNFIAGFFGVF